MTCSQLREVAAWGRLGAGGQYSCCRSKSLEVRYAPSMVNQQPQHHHWSSCYMSEKMVSVTDRFLPPGHNLHSSGSSDSGRKGEAGPSDCTFSAE